MIWANVLALYSIYAIWLLMTINIVLSVGGFLYYLRMRKSDGRIPLEEYPMVSVLVPSHNEGLVIRRTVEALLKFDYPPDKYEIIIINDNSDDNSEQILRELQALYPDRYLLAVNTDKTVGGRGKANALNIGLSVARGSVIAVYDADNTPEKGALRILVENLIADKKAGAVVGKFRARNLNGNILVRFVNIETLAYQCMNQAGRYFYFKLCTIPGTNFVIRRSLIEWMGGWDPGALAEDTEISFRLYRMGYYIKMIPQAVTWEQEPNLLNVWFKQRTRWAKGNIYVLLKNFKYIFDPKGNAMWIDVIYYLLVYVLMLSSLIVSDIIFLSGILGYVHVSLIGFSLTLWGMAILLFVLNILITLAIEENEFSLKSAFLTLLMLFSYSKLWVFVVFYAIIQSIGDSLFKREFTWEKTVRYVETEDDGIYW